LDLQKPSHYSGHYIQHITVHNQTDITVMII